MSGPHRLLPGPAGDLWSYASSTPPGSPQSGHVVLCHDLPRAKGSASDVAQTYPALADRLTRETGWRVVTGTLRGAGESSGDFSAQGWLEDLQFLLQTEVPDDAPRWMVGFGFGGALALHVAATDDRVAGVACLGTPASLDSMISDPEALIERCVRTGVIRTPGYPGSPDTWAKEFSVLHPREDAELMKGRPLLVVHGADDPDIAQQEATQLAGAATGPSDLRVVYGAGHWLRADPRVIAILVGWLERRR
ncbi:MAG TPA: alpha/beta fold hydrolase [Acidimicrobiales bacterium]|nr:alpha/beta fold hydrolase [Acidimicrobiales bacterium]